MIRPADIYAASNDGLDIILFYYPDAKDCVDNKKKFKRRLSEDDASACIKKYGDCYKVTDFGDQGTAMSPIDICMYEENLNFQEAMAKLAAMYDVHDELKRSVNKPDIRKRPAKAEEEEGKHYFELEKVFTHDQLQVLGPRVKQEHVESLHWYVAKSVSYVKNREVTTKYTTETYPIFMRECIVEESANGENVNKFFKIYEPLNPDKQWRFSYTPTGGKPKQYINGLYELRKAYAKFNADEEAAFRNIPGNDDKPYKEKKLPEAFICSGERDALCVRALGYWPLWFNSETYKVSPEEMKEVRKYVEVLYNIPDIDDTGRLKGTELALQYLDVHTVWLPEWLRQYRDRRGKPRKDLRDFVELRPERKDFLNLLTLAMPAQFWTQQTNARTGKSTVDIDSECLHYFLTLNGFYALHDENSDSAKHIRIKGNVVSTVRGRDISLFLRDFARERFLPRDIRNLLLNSQRLSDSSLERMQEISLDFRNYTPTSQFLFFPGKSWEVTADGIRELPGGTGGRYVWDSNVIDHRVTVLPPMFSCRVEEDAEGRMHYDIDILSHDCNLLRYLINTSRTYWRQEMEYHWEDESFDVAERYRQEHHFDIAGPVLSPEAIREQKQNLMAKIFAIGYNLHQYKSPSRAWGLFAMDDKVGADGECNGRSGKSFLFKSFTYFQKTVQLSGRNPRLMDNPHVFDQVNQHTDFVLVDDCDRYLNTGQFYDIITGGMTVNPKNNRSFYIDFADSPKFGFTTNYVPTDFNASTSARLLYMVFSDWYHEHTPENDYLESRSIRDDFGKNLFTDYTEEEWNQDINFFAQCLQFYLQMTARGLKLEPPLGNIMRRKYKADMGANFEDWAYQYFAEDGDHVNCLIQREEALEDFIRFSKLGRWTMQKFTRALQGFVNLCPYVAELNPPELLNNAGRLIRKVEGKSKEMLYIRTVSHPGSTVGEDLDLKLFNADEEDEEENAF